MRTSAAGVFIVLVLAACGGEAADRVAVPGAPPGGDTRPPISAVTSAASTSTSTTATSTSTTEVARSTTTLAPTAPTTTATAPATTIPVTTVAAATTTLAPTTTALAYSPEPADGPLTVGVEGPRSLQVQQQLIALAILPSTAADSKYGPGTASGVRRFQESKGLVVDGVAGPNTIAALAAAVAALTPPTTTTG